MSESAKLKLPWYGGKFVPVESAFRPIPFGEAAARHFTREEIDSLNKKGLLAHELRPKEAQYAPPEHLSKRAQREIFGRTGYGPFARYARGGLLTRKEVDQINEDYAKTLADPNFKPARLEPLTDSGERKHVDLMTLQHYSDGEYPLELLKTDWGEHFKACYPCAYALVVYEQTKIEQAG